MLLGWKNICAYTWRRKRFLLLLCFTIVCLTCKGTIVQTRLLGLYKKRPITESLYNKLNQKSHVLLLVSSMLLFTTLEQLEAKVFVKNPLKGRDIYNNILINWKLKVIYVIMFDAIYYHGGRFKIVLET